MVLKYHISPAPTLLENMVVKIYEVGSESPGQEVWTQIIAQAGGGGHPNPTTITANGLDLVVHRVKLFTAVSDTLLHDYNAEPKADGVTVFDPIRFKIGDGNLYTPAAGSKTYTNPLLEGLEPNEYSVHRNNYGYLFPDIPEVVEPHYTNSVLDGSFTLLGTDEFDDDEEFVIQRSSQITSNVINSSVVGKWFAGFVDITANTDYIADHLRKLIRFHGSPEYTFTALGAPPIGYAFIFQNYGTGAPESIAKVNFLNAPLLWNNTTKTQIEIPVHCEAAFVFDGTNWNVIYINDGRWQNVGTTQTPGTVLGVGRFLVASVSGGNIPAGDNQYTVVHNKNIVGDYVVQLSIEGSASTWQGDNNCALCWWHDTVDKPNQFKMSVEEWGPSVQGMKIIYTIFKI